MSEREQQRIIDILQHRREIVVDEVTETKKYYEIHDQETGQLLHISDKTMQSILDKKLIHLVHGFDKSEHQQISDGEILREYLTARLTEVAKHPDDILMETLVVPEKPHSRHLEEIFRTLMERDDVQFMDAPYNRGYNTDEFKQLCGKDRRLPYGPNGVEYSISFGDAIRYGDAVAILGFPSYGNGQVAIQIITKPAFVQVFERLLNHSKFTYVPNYMTSKNGFTIFNEPNDWQVARTYDALDLATKLFGGSCGL